MLDENLLDFASDDTQAGFRLHRLEVYNWGTFHNRIYVLPLSGNNGLLTGDIGSGKSTIVDAVTTLLVPANRVSYNKAAGAGYRERDLRSYVLGYYKSERSDTGYAARPVALRDGKSYSVILGVFYNQGYGKTVTLAQVFHQKEANGQPARFYVVSDDNLSIEQHFSGFGKDINSLRKNLRNLPDTEPVFDSFPPYGAAFRRRFGLQSDQALELFHQTVSMKTVGNLTVFVREHMLEAFNVTPRIEALIGHFDDLNRAHEAVLTAKDQIGRLEPLSEALSAHELSLGKREEWRFAREGLRVYFAALKSELLTKRMGNLQHETDRSAARRADVEASLNGMRSERDELKRAIAENGGDRLESLRKELAETGEMKNRQLERFEDYRDLCEQLELPVADDAVEFVDNRRKIEELLNAGDLQRAEIQNRRSESEFEFKQQQGDHRVLLNEIRSLKSRKSNIDSHQISLRSRLCEELKILESDLPFAGELIAVRNNEKVWEGAIERLLRNFGLSLLVPNNIYGSVAEWTDRTNLKGRLVYYRVQEKTGPPSTRSYDSDSLLEKLDVKPGSTFRRWVEDELSGRFDFTCCDTMEQFRRVKRGLTRAGQIKGSAVRHEKDDRHALGDRRRYVLGWQNEVKIRTMEKQAVTLETQITELALEISGFQEAESALEEQRQNFYRLDAVTRFGDINWKPQALKIEELQRQIGTLERSSNILKTLHTGLNDLDEKIRSADHTLDQIKDTISRNNEKISAAQALYDQSQNQIAESAVKLEVVGKVIEPLYQEHLGIHTLSVESCDNRQQDLRDWIQSRIDMEDKRLERLRDRIITSMQDFRRDFPSETREIDASLEAGTEYLKLLRKLKSDDLPQFEVRFKELLNENTIREIANFQAQLNKEAQIIKERVEKINYSMSAIEYNKDRYILLEANNTTDPEIRSFRQDLRSCTEGSFTGSDQEQYTESKFLQVKTIINRFRGREGSADLDRRWSDKVSDVRNWFSFAASERWKEDDSEYEHYTDSGGKSGGQKEKLAYTVLAASLAYQFGLEWGETRSASFRFVVIDEAFGRGSDESARYGLELFRRLNLQLLIITPLQKIHIIEPFVSTVGFVHNQDGMKSLMRCLTIEEYKKELAAAGKTNIEARE